MKKIKKDIYTIFWKNGTMEIRNSETVSRVVKIGEVNHVCFIAIGDETSKYYWDKYNKEWIKKRYLNSGHPAIKRKINKLI